MVAAATVGVAMVVGWVAEVKVVVQVVVAMVEGWVEEAMVVVTVVVVMVEGWAEEAKVGGWAEEGKVAAAMAEAMLVAQLVVAMLVAVMVEVMVAAVMAAVTEDLLPTLPKNSISPQNSSSSVTSSYDWSLVRIEGCIRCEWVGRLYMIMLFAFLRRAKQGGSVAPLSPGERGRPALSSQGQ